MYNLRRSGILVSNIPHLEGGKDLRLLLSSIGVEFHGIRAHLQKDNAYDSQNTSKERPSDTETFEAKKSYLARKTVNN